MAKMKIRNNKVAVKRFIKEALNEYGKYGIKFKVRVWAYWGDEILEPQDGKDFLYCLDVEFHKDDKYIDAITHKEIYSECSPWEMQNELQYHFWDEQNALLEWLGCNYLHFESELDRDIAHIQYVVKKQYF